MVRGKINRASETFELNIRYIMALQQVGCCGTKAELVMSFLNLPNGAGMKKGTYHRIENKIRDIIQEVCEKEFQKAVEEEIF